MRTWLSLSTLLALVAVSLTLRASTPILERLSLSAPLMPDMMVFQDKGGAGYPATVEEVRTLVRESILSFSDLLGPCAEHYPDIVVPADGVVLTPAQLSLNYGWVARCAYERYGAKPYWIPQLFDDVDVCGEVLGAGWRLPTEDDLLAYTTEEMEVLERSLGNAQTVSGWDLAKLYYSKSIIVRGRDGVLALGVLSSTAPSRVVPLPIDPTRRREIDQSYSADGELLGVRCFKREIVSL